MSVARPLWRTVSSSSSWTPPDKQFKRHPAMRLFIVAAPPGTYTLSFAALVEGDVGVSLEVVRKNAEQNLLLDERTAQPLEREGKCVFVQDDACTLEFTLRFRQLAAGRAVVRRCQMTLDYKAPEPPPQPIEES